MSTLSTQSVSTFESWLITLLYVAAVGGGVLVPFLLVVAYTVLG